MDPKDGDSYRGDSGAPVADCCGSSSGCYGAIFLYESPTAGRPNELGGSDRHSIELAKARDQSRKP